MTPADRARQARILRNTRWLLWATVAVSAALLLASWLVN